MGLNIFQSTLVWIVLVGLSVFWFRERIAGVFSRIPLPSWLLFLGVGFLFVLFEESINCPPEGCSLIPSTWLVFIVFLLLHLAILKIFRVRNFWIRILIFGAIGWIAEFLLGGSRDVLWSTPWITVALTLWVLITYAIIVIIPVTILLRNKEGSV